MSLQRLAAPCIIFFFFYQLLSYDKVHCMKAIYIYIYIAYNHNILTPHLVT